MNELAIDSTAFPIVGIGASAGGLEALEAFFAATPSDTGMAYVVVSHQSPDHVSALPQLLGKHSEMKSILAADGMKLEPGVIYVNPPSFNLKIVAGEFELSEMNPRDTPHLPIDIFFRSLALERKELAIGIVLSGTATDGTVGLRDIKAASGLLLAQEVSTAKYAGMPESAISTGLVDFILPPGQMSTVICDYFRNSQKERDPSATRLELATPELGEILEVIRRVSGHDFGSYKRNMIERRILRRMMVRNKSTAEEYISYLADNPQEARFLMKELLISVTGFFRDPEAYETLARSCLASIVKSKGPGQRLRGWSAGCATGEEAYSLSILIAEALEQEGKQLELQIFGTDLDAEAIETARRAEYPVGTLLDVSENRLARYFVGSGSSYHVKREIRDKIVFAVHDLIKDPPFTKMDVILCRNLLIYIDAPLQKRVLSMFHYALNPGGILMLGTSEALSGLDGLYQVVDKKLRIFQSKVTPSSYVLPSYPYVAVNPRHDKVGSGQAPEEPRKANIKSLTENYLSERYAPPSAVVNERGDVFYIHGRIGDILSPPQGAHPNSNILDMAREGLSLPLASILRRAQSESREVVLGNVKIQDSAPEDAVTIIARRIQSPEQMEGLIVVSFCSTEGAGVVATDARVQSVVGDSDAETVIDLERELQFTRENLKVRVEELQTSNEELQSANEELQSSNEELETSREELQSLNEELQTVSVELEGKVEQLSRTKDDMQNLLDSIDVAIIFLDRDLRIRRFTRPATEIIKMIDSDTGRPISDLASNLNYTNVYQDAEQVLKSLETKEIEVQAKDGTWCLMRISPYRTSENAIDGLVMTFIDISLLKIANDLTCRS